MAERVKKQESIPWMTPEQAADFLKQVRESMGRGRHVDQRECIDALERPKAEEKDAQRKDLLGM